MWGVKGLGGMIVPDGAGEIRDFVITTTTTSFIFSVSNASVASGLVELAKPECTGRQVSINPAPNTNLACLDHHSEILLEQRRRHHARRAESAQEVSEGADDVGREEFRESVSLIMSSHSTGK